MSISSVVITGANRGLGLEFVKQLIGLSKTPKFIFAICRNPDNANDLQTIANSNPSVIILKADMKNTEAFPSLVQQVRDKVGDQGLTLLINNAGIAIRDSLQNLQKANLIENFEVNVVSPLLLTKEFLPLLQKAASLSGGKKLSCTRAAVVNISSKMGSIDDNTSGACYPYRISKTALNMATKSMSVDLKKDGILALALHPGWVLTEMGGENALINTETSVKGMLQVILKANEDYTGKFITFDDKVISW